MNKTYLAAAVAGLCLATPLAAQSAPLTAGENGQTGADLPQMLLHPLFAEPALCSEHGLGTLAEPGDALGQDCLITSGIDFATNTGFMHFFDGDGSRNEDWYGWDKPVLAPLAGKVMRINRNAVTNVPGTMTPGRATSVLIAAPDGGMVVVAHLNTIAVEEGQAIAAGQPIGTVGNNGFARSPHIHVGAITADRKPAQIRWDLAALGALAQQFVAGLAAKAPEGS